MKPIRIGPLDYTSFWPKFIDSLATHPNFDPECICIARDAELQKYSARVVYENEQGPWNPFDKRRYLEFSDPKKATMFIIKWGVGSS